MPPRFAEARHWVELMYGGKPRPGSAPATTQRPPKDVKQLWKSLELSLGPREEWRVPVLRELWAALYAAAARRRRSADHERVFYQLLGYALRPGFGYPLDEWRSEQCAVLFPELVQFHKDKSVWKEFWVFWRRIAGGLSPARHEELWAYLKPHLALRVPPNPPRVTGRSKGVQPEGSDEMVRLGASLEHLPAGEKLALGTWITERLQHDHPAGGPWTWCLGRLGARVPLFGSSHQVVPTAFAEEWVALLLEPRFQTIEGSWFALAQLARLTGDRLRDIDADLRERVLQAMRTANAPGSWIQMVAEVTVMAAADEARALGDTLPVGLKLL
jgi:hypothetical protein